MLKVSSLKDLDPIDLNFLPSEEDIAHYKQFGWYKSDIILPEELLDRAINCSHNFYDGKIEFPLFDTSNMANDVFDNELSLRNNEFVTLQMQDFQNILTYPRLLAIVSALCNSNSLRLFSDSLVAKYPQKNSHKGVVGWHSDRAYWPTCTSDNMLTVWIPFQDVDIEMGPVMYIDGSHTWKNDKSLKSFYSFNNQNLDDFEMYLKSERSGYNVSYMNLKKGQISVHNCHTIHASRPNVSDKVRMALAIHIQDDSNRYQRAYKDNGERIVLGYDKMCARDSNDDPDYSDNNLFPKIWSN